MVAEKECLITPMCGKELQWEIDTEKHRYSMPLFWTYPEERQSGTPSRCLAQQWGSNCLI